MRDWVVALRDIERIRIVDRTSFFRRCLNYFSRSETIDLTDLTDDFVRFYGGTFEYPLGYQVSQRCTALSVGRSVLVTLVSSLSPQ